jgi:hypothetical protein
MRSSIKKLFQQSKYEPTILSFYYMLKSLLRLKLDRIPIRCASDSLSCNPFFIIGSGRSGNTLLRAILFSHRDIAIPPESYVLGTVVRSFPQISYLNWETVLRMVVSTFANYPEFYTWKTNLEEVFLAGKKLPKKNQGLDKIIDLVYRSYIEQNKPEARRWGDKTPLNVFHLWWIDRIFPKAQYIHIIRDGRDVVSSYLKAGIYKKVEKTAERWSKSVYFSRNFGNSLVHDRYIEIRYEDLVQNPEKEIKKICVFLKIEYSEKMLNVRKRFDKLGDATHSKHHKNLSKPITTKSIGKWKKNLNERQKIIVTRLLGSRLKEFHYF